MIFLETYGILIVYNENLSILIKERNNSRIKDAIAEAAPTYKIAGKEREMNAVERFKEKI